MNIFGDYKLQYAYLPDSVGGRVKAILHIKQIFGLDVTEAKNLVEALESYEYEGIDVDMDVINALKDLGWRVEYKATNEVEIEIKRKSEEEIAKAKFEFLKNKTEMWFSNLDDFTKQMVLEYVESHPKYTPAMG